MSFQPIRTTALALALSAGLMAMPTAQAGVFTGAALFDLFVVDIVGPTTGLTFSVTPTERAGVITGNASADANVGFSDSDPFDFFLFADAFADGEGYAESFADAYATTEIVNNTGDDVEIEFGFEYDLETTAMRFSAKADAFADAFVDIFVDGIVIAGIDSVFEAITADAISGPTGDAVSGGGLFTLFLADGDSAIIDLVVSAVGESVPVPSVLALLGLGLGVLGWQRRTRGAAAVATA